MFPGSVLLRFDADVLLIIACFLEPMDPSTQTDGYTGNRTQRINKLFVGVCRQSRRQCLGQYAERMIFRAECFLRLSERPRSCDCRLVIHPFSGTCSRCDVCGPIELLAMFADFISVRFRSFVHRSPDGNIEGHQAFLICVQGSNLPSLVVHHGVGCTESIDLNTPFEFLRCRIGNLSFIKCFATNPASREFVWESVAGQLIFFHAAVYNATVARGPGFGPGRLHFDDAACAMFQYCRTPWPRVFRPNQSAIGSNCWEVHNRGDLQTIVDACQRLKHVDFPNRLSVVSNHAPSVLVDGLVCFTI
jgi:hypothetical protein